MSKEIKVCFLARPSYDKFSTKIYKCIKQKYDSGMKATFITSNKKETEFVKNTLTGYEAKVYEVSEFFKENWEKFTHENLIKFEEKYDCAPIWKYIYTDRFLINADYEYCVKITTGYFFFYEQIFGQGDYDFYYDETIATLQSYLAYIVAKKYGTTYISQMTARAGLDAEYHYFLADPYQLNILAEQDYSEHIYTEDEINRAVEYLTDFETKDIKPANMVYTGARPRFKLSFALLPLKYIKYRFSSYFNDKYFYMYYKQYKHIFDPLKFYCRYQISKKYYKAADYEKKYVYFPLHYQPEASTIVCAQKYEKQLFFIDSWAKSLPADTMLYVKEHYAILGHRDLSFYKELKKYPNVVLIDPWESSRKLMENAIAVTTLTGTAGWEAMLLRKPVFLGGRIFFENAPGVIRVSDIYDNYMELLAKWKKPEREDVINYLCEMFRSFRKGNVYAAAPCSLEEENIEAVSYSLYTQLNNMRE